MNNIQFRVLAKVNKLDTFVGKIFSGDILNQCTFSYMSKFPYEHDYEKWNIQIEFQSEHKELLKTVLNIVEKYSSEAGVEVFDMDANDMGIANANTERESNDLIADECTIFYYDGNDWTTLEHMSFEKYNRLEKFF